MPVPGSTAQECGFVVFFYISIWRVSVGMCHSVCVEVRGQLARVCSFVPPCGSQGLNPGSSGLTTRALSNEPFHQPRNVFLLFLGRTPGCGEGAGPGEEKAGLWGEERSGPIPEKLSVSLPENATGPAFGWPPSLLLLLLVVVYICVCVCVCMRTCMNV